MFTSKYFTLQDILWFDLHLFFYLQNVSAGSFLWFSVLFKIYVYIYFKCVYIYTPHMYLLLNANKNKENLKY